MKTSRTALATTGLVALGAAALWAHDLYVKMDTYHLPPNAAVTVPILNGTFQTSENSITADRVDDVSLARAGARTHLGTDAWDAEGDTTFLRIRTGAPGTYVLGVSTLPRELTLEADGFNQYLAHDGVMDVLKQRALDMELGLDARERYAKHVKAVFQVGEARTGGLDIVLGYPAELVPLDNPYAMSAGDALRFRALVDRRLVAGQLVLAGGEAPDGSVIPDREARTDDRGIVTFVLDRPGRWYVKFIHMTKADAPDLDYESKWATLTFEIR